MHNNEEWSGTRVAAALARLEDAGYPQPGMAALARVSQSTVNRWGHGKVRPGHDPVRRLALAIWRERPGLARELVEASGYVWAEPAAEDLPPPPKRLREDTKAAMRRDLEDDDLAAEAIAFTENLASGRIPAAGAAAPPESGEARRRGRA